jgi:hypothetical protein
MSASKPNKPAAADLLLEVAPPLPWSVDIDELLNEARFLTWAAHRLADIGDMHSSRNYDVRAVNVLSRMAHDAIERVLRACGEGVRTEE